MNGTESSSEGSGWEGGSSAKVKAAVLATPAPRGTLVGWAEHSSLFYRASGFYKEAKSELRTTGLPKSSRTFLIFPQPPLFFSPISCFQPAVNSTEPGGFVLLGSLQRGGSWAQAHSLGALQGADEEMEEAGTP